MFLLFIAFAQISHADSDGYYCVGPNYIAYEFNLPGQPSAHKLNIVYLGREGGITGPYQIVIPDFQTHGMKCDAELVNIRAWDGLFKINISDPLNPEINKTKLPDVNSLKLDGFKEENLGNWAFKSESIRLDSDDKKSKYYLNIERKSDSNVKNGYGIIFHHNRSKVLQKNNDNEDIKELIIFSGTFEETID